MANKQNDLFITVNDAKTGNLQAIATNTDLHVGKSSEPAELVVTGKTSFSVKKVNVSPGQSYTCDNNTTTFLFFISNGTGDVKVTLPNSPRLGQVIYLKDSSGKADKNNLVLSAVGSVKIDNKTSKKISQVSGGLCLTWNGSNWDSLVENSAQTDDLAALEKKVNDALQIFAKSKGPTGPSGAAGPTGSAGTQGPTGSAGPPGTVSAAGSAGQVQFNDDGVNIGADSGFTYDKTTNSLTVTGDIEVGDQLVAGRATFGGGYGDTGAVGSTGGATIDTAGNLSTDGYLRAQDYVEVGGGYSSSSTEGATINTDGDISANGEILIGTNASSNTRRIKIRANSTGTKILFGSVSSEDDLGTIGHHSDHFRLVTTAGRDTIWETAGVEKMRLRANNGYLGIGTSTPDQMLDVAGDVKLGVNGTNTVEITGGVDIGGGYTSGGSGVTISSAGNLSVNGYALINNYIEVGGGYFYDNGNPTPWGAGATVDTNGNISTNGTITISEFEDNNDQASITLLANSGGAQIKFGKKNEASPSDFYGKIGHYDNKFYLDTTNTRDTVWRTDGSSVKMTLKADTGFLGINTTSPSSRLHVLGNTTLDGNVTFTGTSVTITDSDDVTFTHAGSAGKFLSLQSTSGKVKIEDTVFNSDDVTIGDLLTAGRINIDDGYQTTSNATPGLTIDTDGNIQTNGSITAGSTTSSTDRITIESNSTESRVRFGTVANNNAYGYIGYDNSRFRFNTAADYHYSWRVAGTTRMLFDATNYRLGIGTQSPTATLDVSGSATFGDDTVNNYRVTIQGITAGPRINFGTQSDNSSFGSFGFFGSDLTTISTARDVVWETRGTSGGATSEKLRMGWQNGSLTIGGDLKISNDLGTADIRAGTSATAGSLFGEVANNNITDIYIGRQSGASVDVHLGSQAGGTTYARYDMRVTNDLHVGGGYFDASAGSGATIDSAGAFSLNGKLTLSNNAYPDVDKGALILSSSKSETYIKFGNKDSLTDQYGSIGAAGSVFRFTANSIPFVWKNGNFNAGSTETMRLTAAGYLGIGTSTPSAPLHVVGASIMDGNLFFGAGASGVQANTTSDFTITHVGDSTPSYLHLLSLNGKTKIENTIFNGNDVTVPGTLSTSTTFKVGGGYYSGAQAGAGSEMDTGGNISLNGKLTLSNNAYPGVDKGSLILSSSKSETFIKFGNKDSLTDQYASIGAAGSEFRFTANGNPFVWRQGNFSNTITENMRLTSAGYLGINTDSPTSRLHVLGNTTLDGNVTFTGTSVTITDSQDVTFTHAGSAGKFLSLQSTSGKVKIEDTVFNSDDVTIGDLLTTGRININDGYQTTSNATPGLTIDTSGNIQTNGSITAGSTTSSTDRIKIESNNTASRVKFGTVAAEEAYGYIGYDNSRFNLNTPAGNHYQWKVAGTTRMFFDATNFRLGIGVQNPSYSLDVNAHIRATGWIWGTQGLYLGLTSAGNQSADILPASTAAVTSANLFSDANAITTINVGRQTGANVNINLGSSTGGTVAVRNALSVGGGYGSTGATILGDGGVQTDGSVLLGTGAAGIQSVKTTDFDIKHTGASGAQFGIQSALGNVKILAGGTVEVEGSQFNSNDLTIPDLLTVERVNVGGGYSGGSGLSIDTAGNLSTTGFLKSTNYIEMGGGYFTGTNYGAGAKIDTNGNISLNGLLTLSNNANATDDGSLILSSSQSNTYIQFGNKTGLTDEYASISAAGSEFRFNAKNRPFVWQIGDLTNGVNEKMRLTSTGRLGIGTTSPSAPLHVVGNTQLDGNLTFSGTSITCTDSSTVTISHDGGIGTYLKLQSGANSKIQLDDVVVNGNDLTAGGLITAGTLSVGGGFGSSGLSVDADGNLQTNGLGAFNNQLTVGEGYSSEGTTIDTNGNISTNGEVLIGTDATSNVNRIKLRSNTSGLKILFGSKTDENSIGTIGFYGSPSALNFDTTGTRDTVWRTDGLYEKMRLTADTGRLGIGDFSAADPTYLLQVKGTTKLGNVSTDEVIVPGYVEVGGGYTTTVGGNEGVTITTDGNVSANGEVTIGRTISTDSRIKLRADSTGLRVLFGSTGDEDQYGSVGHYSNGFMLDTVTGRPTVWRTGTTETLLLSASTGHLTTRFSGGSRISLLHDSGPAIHFGTSTDEMQYGRIQHAGTNEFRFDSVNRHFVWRTGATATTELMRLDYSTNELKNNGTVSSIAGTNVTSLKSDASDGPRLSFDTIAGVNYGTIEHSGGFFRTKVVTGRDIIWLTNDTERMRLTADSTNPGRLGIGTPSPQQLLDVRGIATVGSDTVNNYRVSLEGISTGPRVNFGTVSNNSSLGGVGVSGNELRFDTAGTNDTVWRTGSTEKMRLTATNGSLTIGGDLKIANDLATADITAGSGAQSASLFANANSISNVYIGRQSGASTNVTIGSQAGGTVYVGNELNVIGQAKVGGGYGSTGTTISSAGVISTDGGVILGTGADGIQSVKTTGFDIKHTGASGAQFGIQSVLGNIKISAGGTVDVEGSQFNANDLTIPDLLTVERVNVGGGYSGGSGLSIDTAGNLSTTGLLRSTNYIEMGGGYFTGTNYGAGAKIDTNGNIQMNGKLTVSANSSVNDVYAINVVASDAEGGLKIKFGDDSTETAYGTVGHYGSEFRLDTATGRDTVFLTAGVEKMRLKADTGRLGIGTNNPSTLLHVAGTSKFTDNMTFDGTSISLTDTADVTFTHTGTGGATPTYLSLQSTNGKVKIESTEFSSNDVTIPDLLTVERVNIGGGYSGGSGLSVDTAGNLSTTGFLKSTNYIEMGGGYFTGTNYGAGAKIDTNGNVQMNGKLTVSANNNVNDTYAVNIIASDAEGGPKIKFGNDSNETAFGTISHSGGEFRLDTATGRDTVFMTNGVETARFESGRFQFTGSLNTTGIATFDERVYNLNSTFFTGSINQGGKYYTNADARRRITSGTGATDNQVADESFVYAGTTAALRYTLTSTSLTGIGRTIQLVNTGSVNVTIGVTPNTVKINGIANGTRAVTPSSHVLIVAVGTDEWIVG